ncbi:MAG TPA: ribosomal protein S18-alanine N-acetyltransferase [Fimbriimonadales bacterium]|nr:ribosomal protein S18-alanine N-acetyltransferase [Fimbriimonadales bacterium]
MKVALSVRIEPMQVSHLPRVHEIEEKTNPTPWSLRSFRSELDNPQASYFVVIAKDEIVGFAGYWRVIDEAHITTIAVDPNYQGMGIGKKLLAHLLNDAKEKGLRCATLEVRASNSRAIALYEKFGFVRCATRKRYYSHNNEDAVVMWLYNLHEKKWNT